MAMPIFQDTDDTCTECEGHGYSAFTTCSPDHTGVELQRCDSCGQLASDDCAAMRFVRELEAGDPWAKDMARFMLQYGAPIPSEED